MFGFVYRYIAGRVIMETVKDILWVVCSIAVSLTSWMISLGSWGEAWTPANMGLAIGVAGPIVIMWLRKTPIKPKPDQE